MLRSRLPRATFAAGAPIAQLAEAADLKSVQCRFESDWGHHIGAAQGTICRCGGVPGSYWGRSEAAAVRAVVKSGRDDTQLVGVQVHIAVRRRRTSGRYGKLALMAGAVDVH